MTKFLFYFTTITTNSITLTFSAEIIFWHAFIGLYPGTGPMEPRPWNHYSIVVS